MRSFLFSEEGRATRNNRGFMLVSAALLLALSGTIGVFTYTHYTKQNMTPLQRVYLPAFFHSAWRSMAIPFDPKSNYILLVRTIVDPQTKKESIHLCHDHEVVATYGEDGKIQLTKDGMPDIKMKKYYYDQSKSFMWDRLPMKDEAAYELLRDNIFEGKPIYHLSFPSLFTGLLTFIPGMFGAFFFNRKLTKRYLKGKVLRGTRELSPKEYERLHREDTGIGLEVFPVKKGD